MHAIATTEAATAIATDAIANRSSTAYTNLHELRRQFDLSGLWHAMMVVPLLPGRKTELLIGIGVSSRSVRKDDATLEKLASVGIRLEMDSSALIKHRLEEPHRSTRPNRLRRRA